MLNIRVLSSMPKEKSRVIKEKSEVLVVKREWVLPQKKVDMNGEIMEVEAAVSFWVIVPLRSAVYPEIV